VVPFTKNYRKWQVNFTFFLFLSQQKLGVTVFQIASLPTSEIENDKTLAKTEKERKSRIEVLQIVADTLQLLFLFFSAWRSGEYFSFELPVYSKVHRKFHLMHYCELPFEKSVLAIDTARSHRTARKNPAFRITRHL
jgi:hypothetical protein